jgi:hypothetical protein
MQHHAIKRKFYPNAWIEGRRAIRPPEYFLELELIVLERTPDGIWVDENHPAYHVMCAKYQGRTYGNVVVKLNDTLYTNLGARMGAAEAPVPPPPPEVWGPPKWAAIHHWPRLWTGPEAAHARWDALCASLPPVGCSCNNHCVKYLAEHPRTFRAPADEFIYGVNFHNAVNVRLDKPTMYVLEAAALYGFPLPTPVSEGNLSLHAE